MSYKYGKIFLILYLIFQIISSFSCRKSHKIIHENQDVISKEEKSLLEEMERRLIIWKTKKNFKNLKKYLNSKEKYLL